MIFILDKSMNVQDTLSNSGEISHITPFFDDIYTSYLETGAETYQFSTLANTKESQHLTVGNHIAFQYENEYKLFTITEIEETHDENFIKTVYCEIASLKLINKIIRPIDFKSTNLRKFLEEILSDTDWNIGLIDIGLNNVCDIEVKDYTNAYSLLQTHVRESYNGEIHFTVKFEGNKATKYINVYSNRGKFEGFRFSYDSNITSITRTVNFDDLATALIGIGNNGLTFKEIEAEDKPLNQDFITDETSYLLWNDNGSHILGYEKFDTDSPQELLKLTREKLKERCQPKIKYELNPELLGETVKIGDTVYVIDNEFNPPIHLSARINQLSISLTDKSNNSCVLSNFTEITSNITEEMRQIASQLEGYVDGQFPIGGDKIQDGAINGDKLTNGQIIQGTHIFANSITADHIQAETIDTEHLKADSIDTEKIQANSITSNHIQSNTIETEHLKANIIQSEHIQSNTIDANHIISNSINSGHIQTGSITAGSGIIADGAIGNAQISSIDAGKIEAGTIDTSKVTIQGSNGHLRLKGNRMQVFEGTGNQAKERVSVGDVNGDGTKFGLRVRGADGQTILLDENGVTSEGITDGSITNDKISDDANIDGAKLNINSVVSKINEDGTETIQGTKIEVDGTTLNTKLSTITNKQTEDGERITQAQSQISANTNAIKLKVDEQTYTTDKKDMTSKLEKNTSEITTMKSQIALKVEQTDITNAISNINIGARNIFQGYGDEEIVLPAYQNTGSFKQFNNCLTINPAEYVGEQFTISFYAKSPNGTTQLQVYNSNGDPRYFYFNATLDMALGDAWKYYTYTFTNIDRSQFTAIYNRIEIYAPNQMGVLVKKIKIEKGNKATDWTPAPEDIDNNMDTKINSAKAEIKVTTDAISQNVSNLSQTVTNKADGSTVTAINNKVTSLETNVNGISGKVSSLEKTTTTLGGQVSNAQNTANTANNTANSNKTNITNLQGEVTTVKNNVATLDVNLQGITQRVSSTESTVTTHTTQLGTVDSRINTAKNQAIVDARKAQDTRSTNENPQWYFTNYPRQTITEFKYANVIGIGTSVVYGTLETKVPWNDASGGYPVQTFRSNSTATYERKGTSTTAWGAWKQIEDISGSQAKANQALTDAKAFTTTEVSKTNSKVASIETNLNGITSRVSSVETTATTITDLAKAMAGGKILYTDPMFKKGNNGISVYNNSNNGTVVVNRIGKIAGCPTSSTHCLEVKTTGAASPAHGGFYFGTGTRANQILITRIIAKIPTGRNITFASNAYGSGGQQKWLTPVAGTGKWEEYLCQVKCGESGSFSSTNFFYLSEGVTPTTSNPLVWHVAYATVIDITDSDESVNDLSTRMSTAESKITETAITNTVKKNFYTKTETDSQITSKGYQTASQVQQTVNQLEVKFSTNGGYNLLYNSNFERGLEHWSLTGIAQNKVHVERNNNGCPVNPIELKLEGTSGSGSGYVSQSFNWSSNEPLTLSWYQWTSNNGTDGSNVYRGTQVTIMYTDGSKSWHTSGGQQTLNTWQKLSMTIYPESGKRISWMSVEMWCRDTSKVAVYTNIMLEKGTIATNWTPNPNEVYDGVTTIDKDGITVSNTSSSTHTQIDSESFRVENNTGGTIAEFSQNSRIPNLSAGIITANEIYAGNVCSKSPKAGDIKFIYVNGSTGNDNNAGTQASPYKTVQRAIDDIKDKQDQSVTIYVYNSVPGFNLKGVTGTGIITFSLQDSAIINGFVILGGVTNSIRITNESGSLKPTFKNGISIFRCVNVDIYGVTFRGTNAQGSNIFIQDTNYCAVNTCDLGGMSSSMYNAIETQASKLWFYNCQGSNITYPVLMKAFSQVYLPRAGNTKVPDYTGVTIVANGDGGERVYSSAGGTFTKTPSSGWNPSYTPTQKTQTWSFNKIWSDETLHGWPDRQELIQGYSSTWNTGRWTGYMQFTDGMSAIRSAISGGTNLSGRIYVQRTSSSGNSTGSKLCLYASDGTTITTTTSINRGQGVWVSLSSAVVEKIKNGSITYFYLKADSNNAATYFKCESNAKIEITYTN